MLKMVILDQSKPISLYLKIKNRKFKNQKFVNCTFIIHKNGNNTSIQPILNSNSTSCIFNNIFCEIKGKKDIYWEGGGSWGELGNRPNYVLEVKFQYLLGYPSILLGYSNNNHTLCLLLVIYVLVPYIHSFFYLTTALLKSDISSTQMASPPTVFNLQASNCVNCEEDTGAYYQLQRFINKLAILFFIYF